MSIPLFYGVHDLDIQRWLAASEPATVYAQANDGILSQHGYDVDDILWTIIRFQNGVLGVAELGWHYPDTYGGDIGPLVEVIGTEVAWPSISRLTSLSCQKKVPQPTTHAMPHLYMD